MRRVLILVGAIATLAAGVTAAVALGAGTNEADTSTSTTTAGATTPSAADASTGSTTTLEASTVTTTTAEATTTSAGPTTTTAQDTTTGTTTAVAAGAATTASAKVWICHHTGSWKHPYHLIHISSHALPAHMGHGDVTPGADNSCPTTQPAGTPTPGQNGQSNKAKTKHDNPGKGDKKTETNDD